MLSSLLPFSEQDHTQTSHDPCGRWVHVCRETNRVCSHTCESEVAFSSQILTFTMSCRYPRDKSLWQLGLVFSPAACFLLLKPQFFLILLFSILCVFIYVSEIRPQTGSKLAVAEQKLELTFPPPPLLCWDYRHNPPT